MHGAARIINRELIRFCGVVELSRRLARAVTVDDIAGDPVRCTGHRRRENGVAAPPPGIPRGALLVPQERERLGDLVC